MPVYDEGEFEREQREWYAQRDENGRRFDTPYYVTTPEERASPKTLSQLCRKQPGRKKPRRLRRISRDLLKILEFHRERLQFADLSVEASKAYFCREGFRDGETLAQGLSPYGVGFPRR